LKPGTIYHFRIKAVNESGTVYSNDLAFSTLQLPVVSVCSVSSIARTTATLNGKVNAVNLSTLVTIEYGTTISYGSITAPTPNPVFGVSPVYVSAGITGLTEGIAYHFRIKATSAGGTTYSGDNTFTTLQLPSVTTLSATSLTKSTASLNGTVNANNSSTVVTFEYGLSTGYGLVATASQSPVNGSSTTNVTSAIAGLTSNTKYHFRAKSVSNGGTAFGADKIFTTPKF
jgi:hypothetical protein